MDLDEKDMRILEQLKEDSSQTTSQISKKIGIPITTVHNRIKKMEENEIISGYTVELNYKLLGKELAAYILVNVDYKLLKKENMTQYELAKEIKGKSFVENTSMVTGDTDIIIKVRAENIDELNDFVTKELRNLPGVEKTKTMVILNEAD